MTQDYTDRQLEDGPEDGDMLPREEDWQMNQNHPSYNTRSPEDAEAVERMVRAMSKYRVTNCTGGTELRTRSRAAAIARLNEMQFPGDVLVQRSEGGVWATLDLELDDDGLWTEPV